LLLCVVVFPPPPDPRMVAIQSKAQAEAQALIASAMYRGSNAEAVGSRNRYY
jgi:hypothetical protein